MNHQPSYRRGDRIALEHTTDPYTTLTPGTQGTVTGYDPQHGQLHVAWDDGSTLSMLPGAGDRVRLLAPTQPPGRIRQHPADDDGDDRAEGTALENQGKEEDEHPAQHITDPPPG